MTTDILFITKRFIIEYLGIGYLSAALKQEGFTVDLLQVDDDTDVVGYVKECKPKIICYNVWTGSQEFFYRINRRLKLNCNFTSIFGGAHATFATEDLLRRHGIDYVVKGEADYVLPALCKAVVYGDNHEWDKLVSVKKPPQDLDALPLPDRELLYKYKHNRENPIRSIMSSRGCPFACTFCFNSKFQEMFEGKKVRFRTMFSIIKEAEEIKNKYPNTRYFFFQDDELGCRDESLKVLANNWPLYVGIPFHVQMRVEYITERRIRYLKEAGCNSLTFSIESADHEVRRDVLGKRFKNEQIDRAVDVLRKNKMRFRMENMIGIPFCDTLRDMWGTYELNKRIRPRLSWTSLCQPYPQTQLGNRCVKAGLFSGELWEIPEAFFGKTVLSYPKDVKLMLENMQRLFVVLVGFRVPRWLADKIVRMRLPRFYERIGKVYKEHCFRKLYRL